MKNFRNTMRILGTVALVLQAYIYGPSYGLAITHGILFFCIWFNRERYE